MGPLKKIFLLALGSLIISACATPHHGSVSTIPWDDRSQIDGMAQEYGWGEDDALYDGMIAPEQPL